MTDTSDDLVRHTANAQSMLNEASERSFVADTLQGLLDRIEQLEREKAGWSVEKAVLIKTRDDAIARRRTAGEPD